MYEITEAGSGERSASLRRPHVLLTAAEFGRWTVEKGWQTALAPFLPRPNVGRGRPVLVIPGFLAGDGLTRDLRQYLRQRGFHVHRWGLGRNYGLTDELLDGLLSRFDAIHAQHGEPVIVVGWSFGGLLARWLAYERFGAVQHVVCMGSPWRAEGERTRVTALFHRAAEHYGLSDRAERILETLRRPLPVRCTAIFSRTDGILHWRSCWVDGAATENVSVPSSHVGLVSNPLALAVLVDRLSTVDPSVAPFNWADCLRGVVGRESPLASTVVLDYAS